MKILIINVRLIYDSGTFYKKTEYIEVNMNLVYQKINLSHSEDVLPDTRVTYSEVYRGWKRGGVRLKMTFCP